MALLILILDFWIWTCFGLSDLDFGLDNDVSYLMRKYFSVNDVVSDSILVDDYLGITKYNRETADINDTDVQNETSAIWFWDADTKVCVPTFGNLETNTTMFACQEHSYWWGLGTLVFIFMPSHPSMS